MRAGHSLYRSMFVIIGMMLIAASLPVQARSPDRRVDMDPHKPEAVLKGEDFTHSVMMELFVTTWCDRCPTAEEASTELNLEYTENFHYVSMICDVNDDADQRSEDYLVETYPTAIFDGGDEEDRDSENDTSGEKDKDRYEWHIENCGSRDVSATPVDLTVEVTDQGDGNITVSYSATYTGNSQWFDCHIRVYVTERVSRHPNVDDEPIPYGFLDYAFDEDIRLYPQIEQNDQTTVDTEGGEFDNIVVVGAIFDKRTGVERYVVQTASTEEYGNIILSDVEHTPESPRHAQNVIVSCDAVGDISDIIVEVSACTVSGCPVPEDIPMELIDDTYYEADIGRFGDDIVSVHYRVIATDSDGQTSKSASHEFFFDDSSEDDDSSSMMLYGGGAVLILGIALAALIVTRNKAGIENKDDEIF